MYPLTGFQSPCEEHDRPPLSLDAKLVRFPHATQFINFAGEAMEPVISHGDLLVVERALRFPPQSYVYAFHDGQALARRFVQRGCRFFLCPVNPRYPDIEVTESTSLVGLVICTITNFRPVKTDAPTAI